MTATAPQRQHAIEWSVAARTHPGQTVSGDGHVVVPWSEGSVVAVVDGLGHGDEATAAATAATEVIRRHAGENVLRLAERCHEALRSTRGAVMTLVSFCTRDRTLTALGIGNVETVVFRAGGANESVLLRGGVVGYRLPPLEASVLPIAAGDLVVFATDGVREDFAEAVDPAAPLPQMVERIMEQKFRGTDDALVLACKYTGTP